MICGQDSTHRFANDAAFYCWLDVVRWSYLLISLLLIISIIASVVAIVRFRSGSWITTLMGVVGILLSSSCGVLIVLISLVIAD